MVIRYMTCKYFLLWLSSIGSPANAGDAGSTPGLERSPGGVNGNSLQYSCLGNTMDKGAWQATFTGLQKSRTQLSNQTTARKRNNVLFYLLWEMWNSKWQQFVTCHLPPQSKLQYSTFRNFQKYVCVRNEGQARNKKHALELNLLESHYILMLHLPFWAQ